MEAKQNIFKPEVWGPLLRLEAGDPPVDEFFVDGNFKFMVVSEVNLMEKSKTYCRRTKL